MSKNITRFFYLNPDHHSGYRAKLTPDHDPLPLDILRNAVEVYRDEDIVIVNCILSPEQLQDLADIALCDSLSGEAIMNLDIACSYCGEEYTDRPLYGLFWYFPALVGQKQVGVDEETGEPIMQDIVRRIIWK
jgi:hypothetical protein